MPQHVARRQGPSSVQQELGYTPQRIKSTASVVVSGAPSGVELAVDEQAVLDTIGATWGDVLYRAKDDWKALKAGTSGQVFTTKGTGADPAYTTPATGTVTSVGVSTPNSTMAVGGGPVTGTGTLTVDLKDRSITAATYGDATHVPVITLDKYGIATKDPVATAITFPPVGVASVTFGVGAPGGTPAEGDLYFDTTIAVYVGYVGHSGVWNQF